LRLLYTLLDAYCVSTAERSTLAIQGVADDWLQTNMTGWNKAPTGLT
jgi:hypothetical protein